jgi:hypothetical protein
VELEEKAEGLTMIISVHDSFIVSRNSASPCTGMKAVDEDSGLMMTSRRITTSL